ncbi:cupin domain-containing protein [Phenylobacterium sp.]|uniref:cupin domain-containing protein n=1 Tax=Phenylobacterium sp. TaxID=1871053 RepID=UPI002896FEB6|nr:cupin domain-containing protein [Phenylobacterium sp.]
MNFRRVVTGHDSQGRSIIAQDGPAANLFGPAQAPYLINFWATRAPSGMDDPAEGDIPLAPAPGGATFRFFRVPPESASAHLDEVEQRRRTSAYYAQVGAADAHVEGRHPGFHRTASVDYIVLLEGEVSLLVDEGEVGLRPFDVVVQRGTSHAWVNRGESPALMMAVLVDDREAQPR